MHSAELQAALIEVAQIATIMRDDLVALEQRTTIEVERYHADTIELYDLCFWHKSLVRAFLAQVEALCNTMRELTTQLAQKAGIEIAVNRLQEVSDIKRRTPIEKNLALAFRFFPKLFGIDFQLDTGGEDYRALKNLVKARADFTHPKRYRDLCPFEVFATMKPAMEWFFVTWKTLLISCASELGHPPSDTRGPQRSSRFKDEKLKRFEEARQRHDENRAEEGSREDLEEILARLRSDTRQAFDLLRESQRQDSTVNHDCAARNLLRTIFSEIEGSTFVAASYLNHFAADYPLPTEELLTGNHQGTREKVIEMAEAFSKEFGSGLTISRSSAGWENFLFAREIRNRLTHPHGVEDLHINDIDLNSITSLLLWWHLDVIHCFEFKKREVS